MRSVFLFLAKAATVFCLFGPQTVMGQLKATDAAPALYRIQPGDKLSVKFFSNPELNEPSMVVRPDGIVSPQLVDEIKVAGRTVAEVKNELEKAYNEILLSPMITVAVVEFVSPRIYVGGQINKPGVYDLREAKTLAQVIFLAGGFTRDARRSLIIHARPDGNGGWSIRSANVMDIIEQKNNARDIPLSDGDFVYVPESRISKVSKAVEAFRGIVPRFF